MMIADMFESHGSLHTAGVTAQCSAFLGLIRNLTVKFVMVSPRPMEMLPCQNKSQRARRMLGWSCQIEIVPLKYRLLYCFRNIISEHSSSNEHRSEIARSGPTGVRFALLFTCILVANFLSGYVRASQLEASRFMAHQMT